MRTENLDTWYLGQETYVRVVNPEANGKIELPVPDNALCCGLLKDIQKAIKRLTLVMFRVKHPLCKHIIATLFLLLARWSLGAIMYEMLVGYPSFQSPDALGTCRKIVNGRSHFKFPENTIVSRKGKGLIKRLLCDVQCRLGMRGADEIKAH